MQESRSRTAGLCASREHGAENMENSRAGNKTGCGSHQVGMQAAMSSPQFHRMLPREQGRACSHARKEISSFPTEPEASARHFLGCRKKRGGWLGGSMENSLNWLIEKWRDLTRSEIIEGKGEYTSVSVEHLPCPAQQS